jgi:3-methyl-2-oxobutanoate hydroxymethyltransferase
VKLEGGAKRAEVVRALLDAEIPVMGHLGLTPQSVLAMGGYRVQARSDDAARMLLEDALVLQESGVYAVVLEGVPTTVGRSVTEVLDIPTIGIGAGPDTDGQVLVFHDLLGLSLGRPAKFVRQYADLGTAITEAIGNYAADVRSGQFPSPAESYGDSSLGSPA